MIRHSNLIDNKVIPILNGHIEFTEAELNYNELKDEQLASLYVNNKDDGAYNEIVNRYGEKIFRLAMRITKNPESAEEVLQNVFVKLIEKLGTFREESKLATWIYTVSSNEAFMYLRGKNKNSSKEISVEEFNNNENGSSYEGLQIKYDGFGPDDSAINVEQSEILDKAIGELPEEYRVVFQLRDVEGLSNQQAADVLGLSLPAIKSRILRARNQLKKKLAVYFPEYKN
ncbi:MAG: sigma-70 family RNA polymerase sigma factor [Candidatus Dadabacteria bacterium]|nr:sigma-70 family RNA polymerase sigma factor [Candidatus Dadabacteria bacterium]NIS07726.1 sigma-70 family RNA polymerase sigma factor [Candidatus Dadabacteria bacterium]NIV42331.1 sigma-70 family RNA polymerase sigma factor [Candidatus Dadabacteria bacterium]NIY21367.1 sigma-70 family RNA polymerase sigma factor [Candidatus Dadabacteria bacterium]